MAILWCGGWLIMLCLASDVSLISFYLYPPPPLKRKGKLIPPPIFPVLIIYPIMYTFFHRQQSHQSLHNNSIL